MYASTDGGSAFHITWEVLEGGGLAAAGADGGRTLSLIDCPYVDHFNGTYTICCPRPPIYLHHHHHGGAVGISRLKIQVYFLDYAHHQGLPPGFPLRATIYEEMWRNDDEEDIGEEDDMIEEEEERRKLEKEKHHPSSSSSRLLYLPPCQGNFSDLSRDGEWALVRK